MPELHVRAESGLAGSIGIEGLIWERGFPREESLQEFSKARCVFRTHRGDLNSHSFLWNGISDGGMAPNLPLGSHEQNCDDSADGLRIGRGDEHSTFV